MKTLGAIKLLLEEYKQHVERIVAPTKKEYDKQVKLVYDNTMSKLSKLSQLFPDIMPLGDGSKLSDVDIQNLIAYLKRSVETKYSAPLLPSFDSFQKNIYGMNFNIPAFEAWQGGSSKEANFVIHYDKTTESDAVSAMNYLVGNMLLSLPIKRVHLNVVDLNLSGMGALFTTTTRLDSSLCRYVGEPQQLNDFCREMQQRMVSIFRECGDLVKYNEQNQTSRYPFEVVVLLDYPNMYDYVAQQLTALFENGHKGGIYFVVMHNTDVQMSGQKVSLIDKKEHYTEIDLLALADVPKSCLEDETMAKSFFNYINEEAKQKPKAKIVKVNYDEMFKKPYDDTLSIIEVPIGEEPDGNKINFLMNAVDHIHSFIIGQSGSGKSVFLHNIIAGAMLKYRPEDLQFYLLDFKLGGVEFNRYRNSKHVKAMLVDNSDMQVTLEILRDLDEQMKERGKQLQSVGVSNIADYNRSMADNRMPQIMFIADECHAMFNTSARSDQKLFQEMTEIITRIAKEGRNQGVHLVLATQTLAQTDISSEIINNISDRYLLKCASSDSEKMIPGSTDKTANLATGQVFYKFTNKIETVFQSYFTSNKEVPPLMDHIVDKAADNQSNGQFYFNGSQLFELSSSLINSIPSKRNNVAALGCSIDLQQEPLNISLKKDDGENILFFGINDKEQVTRPVMNALVSLVYTAKNNGRPLEAYVMDCIDSEEGSYLDVLDKLSEEGLISIVSNRRDIGTKLHQIAESVRDETASPTLLVVLGQERLRRFLDKEIEEGEQQYDGSQSIDMGSLEGFDFSGKTTNGKKADISTYRKALDFILREGPRCGVNTLLQVDKPANLACADSAGYINSNSVYDRFLHLVMLRADEKAVALLGLDEDIHVEKLSSEPERLRAIYYSAGNDTYKMFTPYVIK